jgi:hypothetical protein
MKRRAPERIDTNRGLFSSPNFLFVSFSIAASAVSNSGFNVLGYVFLCS